MISDEDIVENLGELVYQKLSETSLVKEENKNSIDYRHGPLGNDKQVSPDSLFPEDDVPLRGGEYQKIDFPDPAAVLAFYDEAINSGRVKLHEWQKKTHEDLAAAKPHQSDPYKYCLITCNGSGKDAYIITGFVHWFCLSKIQSRTILTSSSGVQLSTQTESYIRNFAEKVNKYHGEPIYRIRQRRIKSLLSGSEVIFFATDEAGKAEGYHPIEPDAEMAIVVNEGKSVSEEIHGALRRCTGYNYWLEVSTPGAPTGFFHRAYKTWPNVRKVTTYDCSHLSKKEVELDKVELGEKSALFRSKHLAEFTSLDTDCIIPMEAVSDCIEHWKLLKESHADYDFASWETTVGIDLAAGAAENCICYTKGTKVIKEVTFIEKDTEITADRIELSLLDNKITKTHPYIYADDGGVGRSIIDKLKRRGWQINRVLNQSPATDKRMYGNKGAENWYRVKRLIEEKVLDITILSEKTIEQLQTRKYKQIANSGRIFLQAKKDAIDEGNPSPDRADALILALTGKNLSKFLDEKKEKIVSKPNVTFNSSEALLEHWQEEKTFKQYNDRLKAPSKVGKRIFNSLRNLYK